MLQWAKGGGAQTSHQFVNLALYALSGAQQLIRGSNLQIMDSASSLSSLRAKQYRNPSMETL